MSPLVPLGTSASSYTVAMEEVVENLARRLMSLHAPKACIQKHRGLNIDQQSYICIDTCKYVNILSKRYIYIWANYDKAVGNVIGPMVFHRYVLWPAGTTLPKGSNVFFG